MPQKLAGWRIEPPVSVPVAANAACAATAAAEPPDEPPGTRGRLSPGGSTPRVLDRPVIARRARRAHRELVEIGLAEHDRAGSPQFFGHGQFVGRAKSVEDVRPCGRQHALGAIEVLDRDRDAVKRPAPRRAPSRWSAASAMASACSGVSVIKAFKRSRHLDRGNIAFGQFARRKGLAASPSRASARVRAVKEPVTRSPSARRKIPVQPRPVRCRGSPRGNRRRSPDPRASAGRSPRRSPSARRRSVSTSFNCSTQVRICDSSLASGSSSASAKPDPRQRGDMRHGGLIQRHDLIVSATCARTRKIGYCLS